MTGCQMHHFIATVQGFCARFLEAGSNPDDREPLPPLAELNAA